ncbi:MAG: response regulator [Chloroflexi bacterium]|nr:response regulator [Chloroflexota bacterium]
MTQSNIRVLLVEDISAGYLASLETLAGTRHSQLQLTHVSQLTEAVAHLQKWEYDVILLDIRLPDGGGVDSVALLQTRAPHSAIVVLAEPGDEAHAIEAVQSGAQDYLIKGQGDGNLLVRSLRYAMQCKRDKEEIQRLNQELELRVRQRTRELEAIQSSMTEGLLILDDQGRVTYCNPAAARLVDSTPEGVLSKPLGAVLRPDGADRGHPALAGRALLSALRVNSPGAVAAVPMPANSQEHRDLALAAFSIPAESGDHRTGVLLRDVTQERELERRRDAFVSVASHELRTPLTTLLGFVELLIDRDLSEATRQEYLGLVYREGSRLSAIVDGLLNVSRIQSGKLALNLERLPLQDIIDDVLASIGPATAKHAFSVEIAPSTPDVLADRDKLAQVLLNLLDNAVKYSPMGGNVSILADHDPQEQRVVVKVSDQGIGISPDDLKGFFTIFHRVHRPETEGIRGTGLGLYIVKELVELMHGEIRVESVLDHGSTFYFTLPTSSPGSSLT